MSVKVSYWGTRGSLPSPGPETSQFGGNTSCVLVEGREGTRLILDAGTGLRRLGAHFPIDHKRIDILLTHLHMDHIQGLGFFRPLYVPGTEIHLWGPASTTLGLRARLNRYLSPPLFPVRIRDLPSKLFFHEVPGSESEIGEFKITAWDVCHPGPTVGYRIQSADGVVTYLPDHEPVLGCPKLNEPEWVSGYELAKESDLLIHDSQYTDAEYLQRRGWGHSSFEQVLQFAKVCGIRTLAPFHYDPEHSDAMLRDRFESYRTQAIPMIPAREGSTLLVSKAGVLEDSA